MIVLRYLYAVLLALAILIFGPPVHGLAWVLNLLHNEFEKAADHTRLF